MKRKIDKVLGRILIILMSAMVLAILWQIFSRYLLNSPSSFTEELARFLFIWVGILGAAYASGQQTHLAIDILHQKLSAGNRLKLRIGINVLIMLFSFFILVIGGGNLVYVNYDLEQFSAALNLPLFFVYCVLPISGVLIIYYKINEIKNSKKYLV